MKVHELMTRRAITVVEETPLKEAARIMLNHRISGMPVVDSVGRLVGVVSEGDVAHQESIRRPGSGLMSMFKATKRIAETVGEAMTAKVVSVDPDVDHTQAARMMESAGVKRLPVVDHDNMLLGIISRSDLLRVFGREDDDIVTEIESEVVRRILWLDTDSVVTRAKDGVVELTGRVQTRSDARILEEMARRIDGVVRVDVSRLGYEVDDSKSSETPMSGGRINPNW